MKTFIFFILFFNSYTSEQKVEPENIVELPICSLEEKLDELLKSILEEPTEIKPVLVNNTVEEFPQIIQLSSPVNSKLNFIKIDEKNFYFQPFQKDDKSKRLLLEIRKNTCKDGVFIFKVMNKDFGRSFYGHFEIDEEKWQVDILRQSDIN